MHRAPALLPIPRAFLRAALRHATISAHTQLGIGLYDYCISEQLASTTATPILSCMAEPAARRMSLAEFLEWDDGTDTRYELIDGRPIAMAPPIEAYGTIVAHVVAAVHPRPKPRCRVVVEAGIIPAERGDTWYQADLIVTCAPAERGARDRRAQADRRGSLPLDRRP